MTVEKNRQFYFNVQFLIEAWNFHIRFSYFIASIDMCHYMCSVCFRVTVFPLPLRSRVHYIHTAILRIIHRLVIFSSRQVLASVE